METPNDTTGQPSQAPTVLEFARVLVNNETWSIPFVWEIQITNHPRTVRDLARQISLHEAVYEDEFEAALKEAVSEGAFELKEPSRNTETAGGYLSKVTVSGWLWATIILTTWAVTSATLIPDIFPINIIRWVLGSVFVLYLPGFSLAELLFPERTSLDGLERFALSVGLSLAIVMFVGLILNYLPWGIRFTPIIVSLSLFVLSFAAFAAARKLMIVRGASKAVSE
jgi:hypothetical protein